MLDANVLILLLNQDARVVARAKQCFEGDLCLSAIAFAEVLRGTAVGKPPARDILNHAINIIPVLPFDDRAALAYARLPFARHRFDRLIAAHAMSLDLILVTANMRDFGEIEGLELEDWTV